MRFKYAITTIPHETWAEIDKEYRTAWKGGRVADEKMKAWKREKNEAQQIAMEITKVVVSNLENNVYVAPDGSTLEGVEPKTAWTDVSGQLLMASRHFNSCAFMLTLEIYEDDSEELITVEIYSHTKGKVERFL